MRVHEHELDSIIFYPIRSYHIFPTLLDPKRSQVNILFPQSQRVFCFVSETFVF